MVKLETPELKHGFKARQGIRKEFILKAFPPLSCQELKGLKKQIFVSDVLPFQVMCQVLKSVSGMYRMKAY